MVWGDGSLAPFHFDAFAGFGKMVIV